MQDYVIEKATMEDAKEIFKLSKEVYKKLEDKSIFVLSTYEFITKVIEREGFVVKTCDANNNIVGYYVWRYPHNAKDNLGFDIGLSESEIQKVVHAETAVVLEEHRGHGLLSKMFVYAENLIDKENYKYILATVAPHNIASKRTLMKNGCQVVLTKEKYTGVSRDILRKDIE